MSDTTVPSKPLFDRLKARGAKAAFARKLSYSESRLAMMRKRGIPKSALIDIAAALDMTVEQYLVLAGQKVPKIDAQQKNAIAQSVARSDAEKLLAVIQTFLNTDAEGREEILAAVQALAGENGTKHRAENGRRRKRR